MQCPNCDRYDAMRPMTDSDGYTEYQCIYCDYIYM